MGTFKSHVGYTFSNRPKIGFVTRKCFRRWFEAGLFLQFFTFLCLSCGGAANVTVLFLEAFLCFLFSWLLVSTGVPASDSCLFSKPGVTFAFRRTLLQLNTLVFPSIHHKNCGCLYICSLLVTVFRALQLCQKLLPSQKPAIYDHLQTFFANHS